MQNTTCDIQFKIPSDILYFLLQKAVPYHGQTHTNVDTPPIIIIPIIRIQNSIIRYLIYMYNSSIGPKIILYLFWMFLFILFA